VFLSAVQAVDPTSTSYQLGYWGARIGFWVLVLFFVGKFLLGRWRESRNPSPSPNLGVPGTPAPWLAPPNPAAPPAAVADNNPFAPPSDGKHAR
jgi:hypothetical protein